MFGDVTGAVIAVTDYMASLAQGIAAWMPVGFEVLGTDGFGLSESRAALRAHFEVDADAIVRAALANLYRQGLIDEETLNAVNR
jgi:pyruvate dehydrogenase E1 component